MSTFSQAKGAFRRDSAEATPPRAPTSTVTIPLNAYADRWKGRPTAPVTVGLRQLAEQDYEVGAKTAADESWAAYPVPSDVDKREEHFVNVLMRWVVARGTCQRDDVTKPAFSSHDEYVAAAFTPDGIKLLFQAIEDHKITESCLSREITVDGFAALARIASAPIAADRLLRTLSPREKRRLQHCLDEMKRLTADLLSFADTEETYPVIDGDAPSDDGHPIEH